MTPLSRPGGVFSCSEVERFVDALLDEEFAEEDRVELEEHLGGCPSCAHKARFQAAFKAGLKAAVPRPRLPEGLRERVTLALERERPPEGWWPGRVLAPAAAAALVLVLAVGIGVRLRSSPVVADAISRHQRNLPIEIAGGDEAVRHWFTQKVDFAVRPPRLQNAALVGARLANIREQQAAYLVYDVQGAKVSVFVFDPANLRLEARHRRQAGTREIYLDGDCGYHVALYRDHGVGYAFASDLDEDQMFQLVSSAITP